jgi:biopolymer transport protein ExbD
MNWLQRLDVIVLALMLAHIVVVVARVSYSYRLARRAGLIDTAARAFQRDRRKLVAALSIKVGTLKSIALVAPYLGLSGTCSGIVTGFRGIGIEADSALAAVVISGTVTIAFITTVAGLLVAIPAVWSYNYLRTRIDLLESEISADVPVRRSRHFRFTQKFPLAALFSRISFPLIAAPTLAILAGVVFMEYSSYETPTGLYIDMRPAALHCEYGEDRLIVLHITDAGKLFLNQEQADWNSLAGRLSEIYSMRVDRTLYLGADDGAPFQTLADVLDTVENASATVGSQASGMGTDKLDIRVRLVTPRALDARCPEVAFTQAVDKPSGQIGQPDNGESWRRNFPCTEHLKESQMRSQAEHIEMEPDVMGNHVNINGIALMEVEVEKNGRVQCVQALSGHPLAIAHLIAASRNWRFKPYVKKGIARQFCGRLRLKFSFAESLPFVEVVGGQG